MKHSFQFCGPLSEADYGRVWARDTLDFANDARQEVIKTVASQTKDDFGELMALAESPIEVQMGVALYSYLFDQARESGWLRVGVGGPDLAYFLQQGRLFWDDGAYICPQITVNNKYRVDLMVIIQEGRDFGFLAVECDGHDFHSRTKEQARHDRARDRYFASIGLPVIRFTGSEIHKNPFDCAREAMGHVGNIQMGAIHVEGPKN